MVIDLCRAVAAVHGAGLLHRDIKAHNVMRRRRRPRRADGLRHRRELDDSSAPIGRDAALCGA